MSKNENSQKKSLPKVIIEVERGCLAPVKAHPEDAGYDLFNAGADVDLSSGERALISAGFKIQLPIGFEAQIRPRSGNALKKGITVLNTPGTIDCGYTGTVGVIVYNSSDRHVEIRHNDKIAQMVICRLPNVEVEFGTINKDTARGSNGFGSTGLVSQEETSSTVK